MDFFTQKLNNARTFYELLPDTDIKFLFFLASDLTRPKMKTVFKRWYVGRDSVFYVIDGIQNGRNAWYMHVYQQTLLK